MRYIFAVYFIEMWYLKFNNTSIYWNNIKSVHELCLCCMKTQFREAYTRSCSVLALQIEDFLWDTVFVFHNIAKRV